jgi:alpha-1,6-mannosyltransferase
MKPRRLISFSIALVAELLLFGALNFFDDWTLESMPVKFVLIAFMCGIAYLVAVSEFSIVDLSRRQKLIFWSVAILLRLIALPLVPGDDLWRYEWEGKVQRAGFNPYVTAPDDSALDSLRDQFPQWERINHREFRAIYPPGAELIFAGLSRISDKAILYKLLFALVDLATVAVLLRLIGGPDRYRDAAWYGWNPLVVYSFAGAAHFDSLMILPTTVGILFLTKISATPDPKQKWKFAIAASLAFGIAISIKLVPALLLLVCVFALGYRAIALLLSAAIPALLSLIYGAPKIHIWDSLGQFAYVTRLNDLFWWVIEETVWPNAHQKNYHYNVILIACVIFVSLLFIRNWKRGMLWALGVALILSPVLHPWYCTWILPIASWRRARAWHVLSVTLFAYFLFWNERLFQLPWHAEPWMRGIIIAPVLFALCASGLQRARGKSTEEIT